jgi:hypothetical protein
MGILKFMGYRLIVALAQAVYGLLAFVGKK